MEFCRKTSSVAFVSTTVLCSWCLIYHLRRRWGGIAITVKLVLIPSPIKVCWINLPVDPSIGDIPYEGKLQTAEGIYYKKVKARICPSFGKYVGWAGRGGAGERSLYLKVGAWNISPCFFHSAGLETNFFLLPSMHEFMAWTKWPWQLFSLPPRLPCSLALLTPCLKSGLYRSSAHGSPSVVAIAPQKPRSSALETPNH